MLRQFLPSVVEHSVLPETLGEAVVYVADNGSTDDSLALLAKEFPMVSTIVFDENYGFADGYNKAFEQIDAEYAVLLNSDVEVTAGWLAPLVEFMDANPRVAACQPKLKAYHQRDEFEYAGAMGGYLDRYGYPYCRGRIFDTIEKDLGQYDADVPLLWATGACLVVRLPIYKEVGGLDGRFFAHMEEIDLCWRLRLRGHEVRSVASSVVYHVGGATLNAGHPRKTFLNFRNNLLMLYKNLPEGELRKVLFVRALLDYVAAAMFLLKGEWGNVKAVFRARKEYRKLKTEFRDSREENLRKSVSMNVPERSRFSILWKYYIGRCRTFDKL
jgi:GT2 family glycosyltransferase